MSNTGTLGRFESNGIDNKRRGFIKNGLLLIGVGAVAKTLGPALSSVLTETGVVLASGTAATIISKSIYEYTQADVDKINALFNSVGFGESIEIGGTILETLIIEAIIKYTPPPATETLQDAIDDTIDYLKTIKKNLGKYRIKRHTSCRRRAGRGLFKDKACRKEVLHLERDSEEVELEMYTPNNPKVHLGAFRVFSEKPSFKDGKSKRRAQCPCK